MDFSWTKEQEELYQQTLQEVVAHLQLDVTQPEQMWTRTQWERCGAIGLLGLSVPEFYGGRGYGALSTARMVEAFGKGCQDMGLVFSVGAHLFATTMPIAEYGNEKIKQNWLPGLCSGRVIGANAITEQDAGSDVFALQTCAVRDGDSYLLSGTKSFVSNGPVADLFVVYATTKPAHGYLGVSAFVVERATPGLIIGEAFNKMGLTSTQGSQIHLRECRIPALNLLGSEGQGATIFKRSMQWERTCLFAGYLGQMERQLEQTVCYAHERRQFKRSIGKNQAISHRVADMKLRLEAARFLLYRACWLIDRGENALQAVALAKLAISEAAVQGGLDALHIHGATGYCYESGIERMLRDAIPSTIFSGTSEMQRDIIASELGL